MLTPLFYLSIFHMSTRRGSLYGYGFQSELAFDVGTGEVPYLVYRVGLACHC